MNAAFMLYATMALAQPVRPGAPLDSLSSADWLGLLPDSETKRRFIVDCTGCHLFDERIALTEGRPRTAAEFETAIHRMLGYAGGNTGFPVISGDRDARATAAWLAQYVNRIPSKTTAVSAVFAAPGAVTEFPLPDAEDLPHDVALDNSGNVVVTGMMTHQMYLFDRALGIARTVPIPVDRANPRAVEVDADGRWWAVLGAPQMLASRAPGTGEWTTYPVGMYPHSLALGADGDVWFNGHFTRKPELIGRVTRAGQVETFEVPSHPELADRPGGPIPYEIRVGAQGIVWGSELQGNRIFSFDPSTRTFQLWRLPVSHTGPRRLDVDPDGTVWIPGYATNELIGFDPGSGKFTAYRLPIPNAVPYVIRVDRGTGDIWIGTSAADAVLRFRRNDSRFTVYRLPSRGALVRHLAIDPQTHEVWVAYGAWPGRVPTTIARISPN